MVFFAHLDLLLFLFVIAGEQSFDFFLQPVVIYCQSFFGLFEANNTLMIVRVSLAQFLAFLSQLFDFLAHLLEFSIILLLILLLLSQFLFFQFHHLSLDLISFRPLELIDSFILLSFQALQIKTQSLYLLDPPVEFIRNL